MKITITIPDNKAPMLQIILDGVQKLIGKDMHVLEEAQKQVGQGEAPNPRKPTEKEEREEFRQMIKTKTWRKPSYLKKSK